MPRRALSGATPLGEWLADPVGREVVLPLLEGLGRGEDDLGPARAFGLDDLVSMSGGALTLDVVDDLVRAVSGGVLVTSAKTDAGPRVEPEVRQGIAIGEIQVRDPFVLVDQATGGYVLYGSTDPNIWGGPGIGFDAYRSTDLEHWEGPYPAFRPPVGFWSAGMYWAPEVHRYDGRWYMFATFTGADGARGTQVLVADTTVGPFEPWSDGVVTPSDWHCLDGTLHVEDGAPWIVFCREWTDVGDGQVVAQRMSEDLRRCVGAPVVLFTASAASWSRPMRGPGFDDRPGSVHVTDGPFLFRTDDEQLRMLWSSFGDHGYAMGVATSASGSVTGPWTQEPEALWAEDGGHGMVFCGLDDRLRLTLHQPNTTPDERAVIRPLALHGGSVALADH